MWVVYSVTGRAKDIHFFNQILPLKCWQNCMGVLEKGLLPCGRKTAEAVNVNFVMTLTNSPSANEAV